MSGNCVYRSTVLAGGGSEGGALRWRGFDSRSRQLLRAAERSIRLTGAACAAIGIAAISLTGTANATPISIGLGGFSGGETVVNFEPIGNEVLITNQFSGVGVTFGGAIYGMTNIGDVSLFPTTGSVIASNWLYSLGLGAANQGTSITATFDSLQRRVGFYAETNSLDDTTISVELGGNPSGPISFNTSLSVFFLGIEDLSGFDSVTITVSGPSNNFLAIDDFRFEAVPEPGTAILLSLGLVGMAAKRKHLN